MRRINSIEKIRTYQLTDNTEQSLVKFTDNIVNAQGEIIGTLPGKGALNSQISIHLLEFLESYHIPVHLIKTLSDDEILVKSLTKIPFKIIVRNCADGIIAQRLKMEEKKTLRSPVVEYFIKDSEDEDFMINAWHAVALGYVSSEEMKHIERMISKINAILKSFFLRRQLNLIDFMLNFGKFKNKIVLADELTFDNLRLLDINTNFQYDQSLFEEKQSEALAIFEALLKNITGGTE